MGLTTSFLGLSLPSPLIVSSSSLSEKVSDICQMATYGAGAVVLKSLFEEQLMIEYQKDFGSAENLPDDVEYLKYFDWQVQDKYFDQFTLLVKEAKEKVSIPIIGSINCFSLGAWTDYAFKLAEAGIDALEVNLFTLPRVQEMGDKLQDIEQGYVEIIQELRRAIVDIPLLVKLSPYSSNLIALVRRLQQAGASGVTLFNRFYEPSVNIETETLATGTVLSSPHDIGLPLRWTSLLFQHAGLDISSSHGVEDATDLVKLLLVGAKTTQVASCLYRNGLSHIRELLTGLEGWMQTKGYSSPDEFRGKLSQSQVEHGFFERVQFMKYFK